MRRRLQRDRPAKSTTGWTRFAWFLLAICVCLSLTAAFAWREHVHNAAESAYADEAAGVGTTVTTALLRMDDLTISARAKVISDPMLSNTDLGFWYDSTEARRRYPGALGFGYLALVPASGLQAYVTAVTNDPVPGLGRPRVPFTITPSGRRASYCLIKLGVAAPLNQLIPGGYGFDVCGSRAPAISCSRATPVASPRSQAL